MKYKIISGVLAFLCANAFAQTTADIFQGAVAVWNMGAPNSTDGRAPLVPRGKVALGVALEPSQREVSLAQGGGEMCADFTAGALDAGQGREGQLQVSGDKLTLLLRLKPSDALPNGLLFSKHGGHRQSSFNLYANRGDIGFEIGTQTVSTLAASIRIPANLIKKDKWQSVVARYDGSQISIFLDGKCLKSASVSGNLRQNAVPLIIGEAMRGQIAQAALWARALSDAEIASLSEFSPGASAATSASFAVPATPPASATGSIGASAAADQNLLRKTQIEANTGRDDLKVVDQIRAARELRRQLAADPHRPRYHLTTPEGYWNDVNGTLFWKGRYHVMFLGREAPTAQTVLDGKDTERPRETWMHASSADLTHWIHHIPALTPVFDGSMPKGLFSGDAVEGAAIPTLIYHVPGQGICIATAENPQDPELVRWMPHPDNPVIAERTAPAEVRVFDPCAWREADGTYYALVGNKNYTLGYEGDSTSLYRSSDLVKWEYRGPFYKSDRKWTDSSADAACPDFFPIGNGKHMLLMHCHKPFPQAHYYIGVWDRQSERFIPEQYGVMTWPGSSLAAPETLLDDKGRRIFWGWVRNWYRQSPAWGSMATLPRVLTLAEDNTLLVRPAPELETLRHNERALAGVRVDGPQRLPLAGGDTIEIRAKILPGKAREFGLIVRQSENGEEQLPIIFNRNDNTLSMDLSKASANPKVSYPASNYKDILEKMPPQNRLVRRQVAPFTLKEGEPVDLRVFVDKSIVEVFVNDRICLTQLIYPTRADSVAVAVVCDAPITVERIQIWDMHPVQ